MFVVWCVLFNGSCVLVVGCCLLFVGCCLFVVACCSLFGPMFAVRCLLFVV